MPSINVTKPCVTFAKIHMKILKPIHEI